MKGGRTQSREEKRREEEKRKERQPEIVIVFNVIASNED